ncbi:formamidopyrimidine-DNA glycosylase [Anaplasma platys]|uniref:Formamidopyrimidine-DNA glycosylase n=1 Tax=Anaplasma platys TaxID=949 RepID=A0A858PXX5_9RICK|nr:formamidopyrimidine-DNA glycosylase [Anaplasma platys]
MEIVARFLASKVLGKRVDSVTVNRRDLRIEVPADFGQLVLGREVVSVYRVAKYLAMQLDSGDIMVFHLGMSGRLLHVGAYIAEKHDHVVFTLNDGCFMVFNDPRRFGLVSVMNEKSFSNMLSKSGPDPFSPAFNVDYIMGIHGNAKIKPALMRGEVVAGIGNIYASEILFRASVLPDREIRTISRVECEAIVAATKNTLELAIATGGSTIKDYRAPSGDVGRFPMHFKVYNRAGKGCYQCGTAIEVDRQCGRSTFFCMKCQK